MNQTARSILLIDDEIELRDVIERRFTRRGFRVATAADAVSARQALVLDTFDVAVLDRRLPDVDGLELAGEFTRRSPRMQVIVLSGHVDDESMARAAAMGVFGYLSKPCRLDALEVVVLAACDRT